MAENIFNPGDLTAVIRRINSLKFDNKRKWGLMTLPQMLEHCSIQLKLALDMIPRQPPESIFLYRTAIGRWLSLYVIPWPRGFETPKAMDMLKNGVQPLGFEDEKSQLLTLLRVIEVKDKLAPHPFYGPIRQKDWGRLIWVHLNHHLKQFSA